MKTVKVPQLAWYGPKDLDLSLPDDWQVEMCYMAGYDRPALKPDEIRAALERPVGTRTISELAKGKRNVAIIFDDMTRVTRPASIVSFILQELAEAGITDKNIEFICALGLHGTMDRFDFAKKLGDNVVAKYRVFNHNAFGNCVYVGTTRLLETRVHLNEEVMKCDLKIAVTGCVPHPVSGFGGGGKIVLPGIASFETVHWHHTRMGPLADSKPNMGMGVIDGNPFREDIVQAAELARIDFYINVLVNLWGDTVAIHAGGLREAHDAAAAEAKRHYRTPKVTGRDIVIANVYAKSNEAAIGLLAGIPMVGAGGGDIVFIANAPDGQISHYLSGPWGKTTYAPGYSATKIPQNINHVIQFSEYPHPGSNWFPDDPRISYLDKWDDVIRQLQEHHGPGTRLAVIPDGSNQYFA